jgi:hypothetical protein
MNWLSRRFTTRPETDEPPRQSAPSEPDDDTTHSDGGSRLPEPDGKSAKGQKEPNESSKGSSELRKRILQVAIPGGVITALLYYLGWAFTKAQYKELGVDHSSLGFSTTDYVLRSLNVLVEPIPNVILLGLVGSLLVIGLFLLVRALPGRWAARLIVVLAMIGFLGVVLSWSQSRLNNTLGRISSPLLPGEYDEVQTELATLFSLLVLFTAVYLFATRDRLRKGAFTWSRQTATNLLPWLAPVLARHNQPDPGPTDANQATAPAINTDGGDTAHNETAPVAVADDEREWLRSVVVVFAVVLLISGLFDLTRKYADDAGIRRVESIRAEPDFRPEVVIFSPVDLGLEHIGAHEETLTESADKSLYRYSGLRLFAEANGRLLVWSCDVNPETAGMVLVPLQDGMWFAVRASNRSDPQRSVYCETNLDTIRGLYDAGQYEAVVAESDRISQVRSGTAFAVNASVYSSVAKLRLGIVEPERTEIGADLLAKRGKYLSRSTMKVLCEGLAMVEGSNC